MSSRMILHFRRNISPSTHIRCGKKSDLAFSKKQYPFTKKMWEIRLCLKIWCPDSKNTQVKRQSSTARGYKFGCVCSYMAGLTPCVRLQSWVCLICVVSTYSNGAVQIRVGLELGERVDGELIIADWNFQARKRSTNSNFWVRMSSCWGGGASTWRGGRRKVWYVPRNPTKPNIWAGYPGIFIGIARWCPKSLREKCLCSIFGLKIYPVQDFNNLPTTIWIPFDPHPQRLPIFHLSLGGRSESL